MSDDIDIEEHDLLQHPHIRNMFPDLSCVKQEVQDVAENEYKAVEYDSCLTIKQEPIDMQSSSPPWQAEGQMNESLSNNQDEYHSFPTKIILGSKPCRPREIHTSPTDDNLNAFVLVEDWGSILAASACFCNICKTLFPTENAFDAHKMAVHSFLVAIDSAPRNVAVKSTSKTVKPTRNIAKKSTTTNKPPVGKLCNHCNVVFADDNALVKHLYELLPVNTYPCEQCNEIFDTKDELVAHSAVHNHRVEAVSGDRALYYVCPVCKCSYRYVHSFTNHMIHNHGMNQFETIKSEYTGGCLMCPRRSISRTKCNEHIKIYHSTLFHMKISTSKPNAALSGVVKNKQVAKFIKPDDSVEVINVPGSIAKLPNDSASVDVTNGVASEVPSISYMLTRKSTVIDPPVPVSALFKCRGCSFHFLSCYAAEPHAQRCSTSRLHSWKCPICHRIFKETDRALHLLQHEYVNKFQIYSLPANLFIKLLSVCPRCRVYFDELRFWEHWQAGCDGRSDAYLCPVCNIDVSVSCRDAHVRKHKHRHKFTKKNFIILKYVDRSRDKSRVTNVSVPTENDAMNNTFKRKISDDDSNDDLRTVPVKKIKSGPSAVVKKKRYIYCSVCECYMIRSKLHSTAECVYAKKQICTFCGLTFTRTVIGSHFSTNHFNNKSFKITDAVYVSLQNGKRIVPPVPSYFTCKRCQVCFSSSMYLRSHNCGEEACRHCAICNRNYTPAAYKLHMGFHRYAAPKNPVLNPGPQLPDLIKNYEAIQKMWDILYLCVACDVVTDSYDQVIDHCQGHYNYEEGLKVDARTCKKCNLKFHVEVFSKHTELHARNEIITKATFSIVDYDYKNFTSDHWLRNFRNLPESQFRQVLNRSIYAPSRFLKMEMIQDGSPALTIYKCEYCSHHVHSDSVNKHKSDCKGYNVDYNYCETCDIRFASQADMENHEESHKTSLASKYDFRIVAFNNIVYRDYDETLKRALPNNRIGKYKSYDDDERLPAFVCRLCKAFVQHKHNTRYHSCSPASYLERCPMCMLHFKKSAKSLHRAYHNKNPGFVKDNITVITFKPRSVKVANEKNSNPYTVTAKIRLVDIYRCACGLHFASMNSIKRHFEVCEPGYDVSKETCSKCNYLFPTSDLVSHLCNHHNEKKPTRLRVVDLSNKTVTAYKCDKCKLLFCERAAAVAHYGECGASGEPGERCDRCNLIFHPKMMPVHRDIHRINKSFSNHIVTINKMHANKSPVHFLYKCGQCDVHFIKRDSLRKHMKHTEKHGFKYMTQRCAICNLGFTKLIMEKHMRLHHKQMKPNTFHIVEYNGKNKPLNYLSQGNVERNLTDVTNDGELSLSKLKETLVSDNPILCKILTRDRVGKDRAVLEKNKKDGKHDERCLDGIKETPNMNVCMKSKGEKHYLFECLYCSLNFINSSTIRTHMRAGNHSQASVTCPQCGLNFNEFSLPRHEELHHGKISREVVVLKSIQIDKNNADVLCNEDNIIISEEDLNDARRMRELEKDENSNININYTYKCGICHIHYNKLRSLKTHINADRHDEDADILYPCPECGFIFNAMSLENHIQSCHRRMNLKRENMKVVTFLSVLNDNGEFRFARDSGETSSKYFANGEKSVCTDVNISDDKSEDGAQCGKALKIKYNSHDSSTIESAAEINCTKSLSVKHRIQFEDEISQHENAAAVPADINKKSGVTFTDCLFLCPTCDMPFLKPRSLLYHLKCNQHDVNELLDCDVCGLKFTEKTMPHHKRLHHDLLNIKQFRFIENCVDNDEMNKCAIGNVLVSVDEIEETVDGARKKGKHVLFKCSECPEHHPDVDTVKQHIASGRHDVNLIECYPCPECGLAFQLPALDVHIEEDHEVSNKKKDDFYVVTVRANVKPKIPKVNDSRRKNQLEVEKTKVEIKETVKKLFKGTPMNPAEYNEYLYQCNKCPLNFIKYSALHKHMVRGVHNIVGKTCDLCGHVFSENTLSRHSYVHHEVNGIHHFLIWKALNESDFDIDASENNFNESSVDESQLESNLSVNYDDDKVLYKCHRCPGYFINRHTLTNHLERHSDNYLNKCPECDYNFKNNAIDNHIRLHHKKLKMKRDDFKIVTLKSSDDNTGYLDDIAMDTRATEERMNDSVLNKDLDSNETDANLSSDTNAVTEDSDLNETNANREIKVCTDRENVIQVSDLNEKHEIDAREKNSPKPSKSHKVTLYKCAECNVYYLNQRACYKHTMNHKSLDPIDYIECKFCNLQFTLLSLKEHLKKHHTNNELRLEDIEIEEHKVNNSGDERPVIDIYCAADRLQSKDVSTTS